MNKATRITTNILQVTQNKKERAAASFIITPEGKEFYQYKGDRIKPNHFALMLPVEIKQIKTY